MTNTKRLPHTHLLTLSLVIDQASAENIGKTPNGIRQIVPVTGGSFSGERVGGRVRGGADWVVFRADRVMTIDVRLVLEADTGSLIYLNYQGRLIAEPEVLARMGQGEIVDSSDYSLAMVAKFESGDQHLNWLNNVVAVGSGEQISHTNPVYEIYEIR